MGGSIDSRSSSGGEFVGRASRNRGRDFAQGCGMEERDLLPRVRSDDVVTGRHEGSLEI